MHLGYCTTVLLSLTPLSLADYAPSDTAPLDNWVFELFAGINEQHIASYSNTHLRLRSKLNQVAQTYANEKTLPEDAVQALSDAGVTSDKAVFISTEADSVDDAINNFCKVSPKDATWKAMKNHGYNFVGVGVNTNYWVAILASDLS